MDKWIERLWLRPEEPAPPAVVSEVRRPTHDVGFLTPSFVGRRQWVSIVSYFWSCIYNVGARAM